MSETVADPPFEPLLTERLEIRAPVIEDLDFVVELRNHPDVAFYQDWPLPYPEDRAREHLEGTIKQARPLDDDWWSVVVCLRDTGQPIGDLVMHITNGWRAAEVGYSFHADHWGNGYAIEAVNALLDYLFDQRGIRRASASFHPDNVASAMVLERAGFVWEGQTKLSFFLDDRPEPENSDDGWYGLTKADRDAWLNRPMGPPDEVKLKEITSENQRQIRRLGTHKSQERLVAPVLNSFADALFPDEEDGRPVAPRMWFIEADGEPAGFVMIAESTEHHPDPYLWRLLIDRRFQRRGIGARAVELVEDYCRAKGDTVIYVSWDPGRGSPEPFYLARGYVPTGVLLEGEVEARKDL